METVWYDIWQGIRADFADLPGVAAVTQLVLRLLLAALLGGPVGRQQERQGLEAGLRTHTLVALGSALFVLVPRQAGMALGDLSRVLQGLLAGLGFLLAGVILTRQAQGRIRGLTAAAGLWLSALVGVAVGLGRDVLAVLGTVLAFVILALLPQVSPSPAPDETPRQDTGAR
jgi:putative Mg2+ transporter-C (MgtC) family protein